MMFVLPNDRMPDFLSRQKDDCQGALISEVARGGFVRFTLTYRDLGQGFAATGDGYLNGSWI